MHAHDVRLLAIIHKLVAEAAATKNFVVLLKKLATRNQRKSKGACTREELLNILRKIEVTVLATLILVSSNEPSFP